MNKQLTDRQIWQIWNNEYKRWVRAGFSIPEAARRADDEVSAKRAKMRESAAETDAKDKAS
jgi:hypothetical protein